MPDDTWKPMRRATKDPASIKGILGRLGPKAARLLDGELYANDRYTAILRRRPAKAADAPDMLHISFRANDRRSAIPWKDKQRLKNDLVGAEVEMVELFPAESRLVDTSNQYHLWGLDDPTFQFPFGWWDRIVNPTDEEVKKRLEADPPEGSPKP